jgi:hypothetical protein
MQWHRHIRMFACLFFLRSISWCSWHQATVDILCLGEVSLDMKAMQQTLRFFLQSPGLLTMHCRTFDLRAHIIYSVESASFRRVDQNCVFRRSCYGIWSEVSKTWNTKEKGGLEFVIYLDKITNKKLNFFRIFLSKAIGGGVLQENEEGLLTFNGFGGRYFLGSLLAEWETALLNILDIFLRRTAHDE